MLPAHRTAPLAPHTPLNPFHRRLPVCVLALIGLLLPFPVSSQQTSTALFSGSDSIAHAVAVNPAKQMVYFTYDSNSDLRVIDGHTNTLVADLNLGGDHNNQIAINPITNTIYVSNAGNYVSVIDGASNNVITSITVGNGPDGIAVNLATNRVYVLNRADGTMSVIDGTHNGVIAILSVGPQPFALAVDSTSNRIYASSLAEGTVRVIDGATNAVTATVRTGTFPNSIALDPAADFVYVANQGSDTVSYFRGSNPTANASNVSGTFSSPQQVVVNPATHTVYVANSGNQTVSYFAGANGATEPGPAIALALASGAHSQNVGLALDQPTNTIYAGFYSASNNSGTDASSAGNLFLIDGVTNRVSASFGSPVAQFSAVDPATFTGISSGDVLPGVRTLYVYGASATVGGTQANGGAALKSSAILAAAPTDASLSSGSTTQFQLAVVSGTAPETQASNSAAVATTTTLESSLNPSTFGQSVTLSATVSSASGAPAGTVNFLDGATLIGSASIASGMDVATFSTSALGGGSHSLTASYLGSIDFLASTSAVVTQVVNKAATTTTLSSTPNPSNFGQTVALNVTVTSLAGTPTGTVNFFNGATLMISGTLANGKASINVSSLPVGTANFSAVYVGTANFATSSAAVTQTINPVPSTTTLTSSINPSTFGQSITLTATVTASPFTPTGTVNFFNGASLLGSGTLASGKATFSTSALPGGANNLTATYVGTTNLAPSTSSIFTQTVNPAPTATSLTAAPNPSTYSQSVTFTSTVSSTAGAPGGTVNFLDGPTLLGSATLTGSTASFSTSSLTGGPHSMTAVYAGSANFATSPSTVVTQTVNPAATVTSFTSSPNPSTFNQSVTLSATVSSTAGTPAGSVNFFDGATQIGSGTLAGGTATFSLTSLSTATHSLTAAYVASTNFSASTSSAITQAVNPAPTTATLSSAPNPSSFNDSVTLTAAIASSGGTPAGTVNFFDGATLLGSGTLAAGSASLSTSALTTGAHTLFAAYLASANFAGSTSANLFQTVNPAATVTSLSASPNPSTFGQNVLLSATVASSGGTPAGTVNFFDGSSQLGSAALSSGSATFSISTLSLGPHSLTAVYVASTDFSASTSSPAAQTVNPAATVTSLASSLNPSVFGGTVTLTATVTSAGGSPSGTVNFFDGAAQLGSGTLSGGVASFSTNALAAGTHNLNATFVASGDFASSSSAPLSQTVNPAGTTTALSSSPNPSAFGQNVMLTATVTSGAGIPTGTVNFFSGVTLLGSGTLSAGNASFNTSSLPAGNSSLTAVYVDSANFSGSNSTSVVQNVNAAATATALASSQNPSTFGQSVTLTATVTSSAGIPTGSVSFFNGSNLLIATVPLASGSATEILTNLVVGQTSFTASYIGSTNFAASASALLTQQVNPAPTSTLLASTPNPSQSGQSVTFTASVVSVAGTPAGSVNFFDGAALLGSAVLSGGSSSFSTAALSATTHTITAAYVPSVDFVASTSNSVSQTVISVAPPPNSLTMHLASSVSPSAFGERVEFVVTLAPSTPVAPTGSVTFSEDNMPIGECNLHPGLGLVRQCSVRYSNLSMGTTAITATFSGDATYAPQSVSIQQTVVADATFTYVQTSPNPSLENREVLLAAFVSSRANDRDHNFNGNRDHEDGLGRLAGKRPKGTVTFYCDGAAIGSDNLDSGFAKLKYVFAQPGVYKITAVYSGSATDQPSTSRVEIQVVKQHKNTESRDRD